MAPKDRITTMERNGPPPGDAAALYPGEVMHARLKPFAHRFTYRVFSLLVDLDRLDEAGRLSALFSVNRANILSFREADHLSGEGGSLRRRAERLFAEAGIARPARILLLAYPRLLGYVFNPISVYFAYDDRDELVGLVYAVNNTFGESHAYVAPVAAGDVTEAGIRQTRAKVLHVSPFVSMDARYHFRILPPGRGVRLRIHETEAGDPLLSATFVGRHEPLTSLAIARNLLKTPAMTWKIMAGIHWEALRLWLKGAAFFRSPPPPAKASFRDRDKLVPGE